MPEGEKGNLKLCQYFLRAKLFGIRFVELHSCWRLAMLCLYCCTSGICFVTHAKRFLSRKVHYGAVQSLISLVTGNIDNIVLFVWPLRRAGSWKGELEIIYETVFGGLRMLTYVSQNYDVPMFGLLKWFLVTIFYNDCVLMGSASLYVIRFTFILRNVHVTQSLLTVNCLAYALFN